MAGSFFKHTTQNIWFNLCAVSSCANFPWEGKICSTPPVLAGTFYNGGSMNEVRKILVVTDFSAYANRSQHVAGSLCAKIDSSITLLYVLVPEKELTPALLPELF